jgi:hypothetical protein
MLEKVRRNMFTAYSYLGVTVSTDNDRYYLPSATKCHTRSIPFVDIDQLG